MKIDYDRLNHVIGERPTGQRGLGRTFATCHQVVLEIRAAKEVAEYVWHVTHHEMRRYNMDMLCEMARYFGVPIARREGPFIEFGNGCRVRFVIPGKSGDRIPGVRADYSIVDDFGEYEDFCDENPADPVSFSHLTSPFHL